MKRVNALYSIVLYIYIVNYARLLYISREYIAAARFHSLCATEIVSAVHQNS